MASNENQESATENSAASTEDQALDSLGIVVSEISHEFNNILSLISGYVEMAMSELPEGQRARSDLEHVLAASERAKELVARIRTFSKTTKLKQEAITVDKPVADALADVSKRGSGQVKINADIEAGNGRKIFGNATEIYKVISNLCLNSIQSMPETGGEITVKVGYLEGETGLSERYPGLQDGDYLKISVQDNGSGMSMDTVQKMYLPFYSGSEVAEGARKRAGLGLTSVHNIVSSQGGLITVDSELGRGTLFEIFLPLISSEISDSDAAATQSEAGTATKRIMLVDDEPPILEMATRMLTRGGFKVVGYLDGNEALENFKKYPYEFDLIITDLIMPSISGSELASQISALNPNVPIILSTGFSDKISKSTCSSWGVDRVVNKPFKMRELLSTVESLS